MAIRYKVKVINSPNGLPIKLTPALSASAMGYLSNGAEVVIDNMTTSPDTSIWFRIADTDQYIMYKSRGTTTAKIISDITFTSDTTTEQQTSQPSIQQTATTSFTTPSIDTSYRIQPVSTTQNTSTSTATLTAYVPGGVGEVKTVSGSGTRTVDTSSSSSSESSNSSNSSYASISSHQTDVLQQNSSSYPPLYTTSSNGENIYDYTIDTLSLKNDIQKIKENLNIPSAFSRDELDVLMNKSFNRYDILYPDYLPYGLRGVVFFTRPDLNLVDDTGDEFLDQVKNDPQLYYISRANDLVLKQLTLPYTSQHEFIPLLCNTCESLDIGDESVETFDSIGETWTGYKMQYAKHSVRSNVAGTFNCKFRESHDLAVTHMMQVWCSYESSVYLGTLFPKDEYMGDRILDYACDVYYFLLDRWNTIKFYSKYYGVFPTSVNKSVYSYDDSAIHFPEQNITFAYFQRVDLLPNTLVEFNKHSSLPLYYKMDYEPTMGHSGTTWSGPPFVEVITSPNGKTDTLKLRYRTKQ